MTNSVESGHMWMNLAKNKNKMEFFFSGGLV